MWNGWGVVTVRWFRGGDVVGIEFIHAGIILTDDAFEFTCLCILLFAVATGTHRRGVPPLPSFHLPFPLFSPTLSPSSVALSLPYQPLPLFHFVRNITVWKVIHIFICMSAPTESI